MVAATSCLSKHPTCIHREQLPVVVFCFSKKKCDALVDSLASLDLTSADDKSDIQVLHHLLKDSSEDQDCPPATTASMLLCRGAVHRAVVMTMPQSLEWFTQPGAEVFTSKALARLRTGDHRLPQCPFLFLFSKLPDSRFLSLPAGVHQQGAGAAAGGGPRPAADSAPAVHAAPRRRRPPRWCAATVILLSYPACCMAFDVCLSTSRDTAESTLVVPSNEGLPLTGQKQAGLLPVMQEVAERLFHCKTVESHMHNSEAALPFTSCLQGCCRS